MDKKSIYEVVTNRILEVMDRGVIPWKQSWNIPLPSNYYTGYKYKGINLLLLNSISTLKGWTNQWLTFNQILSMKSKLRYGAKGFPVLFWKKYYKDSYDGETRPVCIPLLRYYTVFNKSQCQWLPERKDGHKIISVVDSISSCKKILSSYSDIPKISYGNYSPSYNPKTDEIRMPDKVMFDSIESYYSTLFHEIIHSSGHLSRLDRKLSTDFMSEKYSKEELTAELGSAYLSAMTGISNDTVIEHQSAYILNWMNVLKKDNSILFKASSQADKAVSYITNDWRDSYVEDISLGQKRSTPDMQILI